MPIIDTVTIERAQDETYSVHLHARGCRTMGDALDVVLAVAGVDSYARAAAAACSPIAASDPTIHEAAKRVASALEAAGPRGPAPRAVAVGTPTEPVAATMARLTPPPAAPGSDPAPVPSAPPAPPAAPPAPTPPPPAPVPLAARMREDVAADAPTHTPAPKPRRRTTAPRREAEPAHDEHGEGKLDPAADDAPPVAVVPTRTGLFRGEVIPSAVVNATEWPPVVAWLRERGVVTTVSMVGAITTELRGEVGLADRTPDEFLAEVLAAAMETLGTKPERATSNLTPTPEDKPAPPTDGLTINVDDRLRNADSLRSVMSALVDRGFDTYDKCRAAVFAIATEVPVVSRIKNLDERVERCWVVLDPAGAV